MGEQPVDDLDRLLGIVDGDVDVHAEDQLAAGDVLQLVDEVPVPVACGDPLAFEERERVRAGRADAHALRPGDVADIAADLPQLRLDRRWRPTDGRRDLEHRLHQLRIDTLLELVSVHGREHRLDVLDEVERLAVEQHVLLFDAERVRIAFAKGVVEDAAARREAGALAGDRGGGDLLRHRSSGRIASASISTIQRGSRKPETTIIVLAGRTLAKNSPWARPTSRQSAGSTRNVRVRTTSSSVAPASSNASATICRQRRAWP